MNIDERLEALTHSVELLASLHRDNEKRMERLDQHMEDFAEEMKRLGKRNLRLEVSWSISPKEPRGCCGPSKPTNSASAAWKGTKLSNSIQRAA
jgi:hypothetical protein